MDKDIKQLGFYIPNNLNELNPDIKIIITQCNTIIMKKILENNVYKLELNKTRYFVPLWHDELYFDGSGCDIIVKCIPDLPNNIYIDENNNLFVDIEIQLLSSLFDTDSYIFQIGKKTCAIQLSDLKMQRVQYVSMKNEGISEIDEKDMYNVKKKSDINLKITFV